MIRWRLVVLGMTVLVLGLPRVAAADITLEASVAATALAGESELGVTTVPNLGRVRLLASRSGPQVAVQALGPDGRVVGRAESSVGLRETPILVTTARGLETIRIVWPAE